MLRPADRCSPGRNRGTGASRPDDDDGLLRKLFGQTLLGGKSGRSRCCRGEGMSARRHLLLGWAQQQVRALSRQQTMWACPSHPWQQTRRVESAWKPRVWLDMQVMTELGEVGRQDCSL